LKYFANGAGGDLVNFVDVAPDVMGGSCTATTYDVVKLGLTRVYDLGFAVDGNGKPDLANFRIYFK
jgi:hypothetical protein